MVSHEQDKEALYLLEYNPYSGEWKVSMESSRLVNTAVSDHDRLLAVALFPIVV
jgi:hypothetical protein